MISLGRGSGDGGLVHVGTEECVSLAVLGFVSSKVYEVKNIACAKLASLLLIVFVGLLSDDLVNDSVVDLCVNEQFSDRYVGSKFAILDLKLLESFHKLVCIKGSVGSEILFNEVEAAAAYESEKRHHNSKN